MMRIDGRSFDQLRQIKITPHVSEYAEGSCIVEFGRTKVLCTATYESKSPPWLVGSGAGWVTAEYGMLPRSTHTRIKRDKALNAGRTQEISRLIGRSLRAAVDLKALGEKQIIIDCDVLNADGGTRTASITGGFVAMAIALKKLHGLSEIKTLPLVNYVSAVSVGLENGQPFLDLNYEEDSAIGTDMNFVMTDKGQFVEVQGTAEHTPFSREELNRLLDYAEKGCRELFIHQAAVMGEIYKIAEKR